jgi:hypothetical protein
MFRYVFLLTGAFLPLYAEGLPRLEVTGSWWRPWAKGTIQSGILPIELRSDLALRTGSQFFGTALIKVAERHRIVVEGSPLRYSGNNQLARTIVYNNRSYFVQDVIGAEADLTYFFLGYQWEFLSRNSGRLGLRGGGAYLDASGQITSASTGITASSSYRTGLPLAGLDGEWFVYRDLLEVHGGVQGMPLGGYGYYVQGGGGIGVHFGFLGIRAGYWAINADVHERGPAGTDRAGVAPDLAGPMFSIVLRTR